ncbi:TPA: hypothetical protein UOA92_000340 [Stenotrophomonas maltophilia]|nr:hypothetical protein [Stenotrophomonas maltophilia]
MVDWTGGNAAAWAQAILSGLAILYSGRLASRQRVMDKREKLETYVQLLAVAAEEAALAVHWLEALRHKTLSERDGSGSFQDLRDDLQSIEVNDIPDHRLIRILRDAAWACDKLHHHYDVFLGTREIPQLGDRIEASNAADLLENCFEDAAALRDQFFSLPESIWRTVRRWTRQRSHKFKLRDRHPNPR